MQWLYLMLTLMQPAQQPFAGPNGFDFFLGAWHAEQRWLQEDMRYDAFTNRVKVFKILHGHGIQDDNFKPVAGRETYFGSAYRIYDAAKQRWICRWFDGGTQKLSDDFFLSAEGDGFSGYSDGKDKHGSYRSHIRFHHITKNQFKWQMIRRYEGLDRDLLIGEITYTRIEETPK
ncbi:hypothetical protein [Acanthopleuribacter pedis]|uniref:DUF1579 domain-containing protein n=1 Tax=Acanthopleuribacter pedis TaxID=442870 RepID=A0A8J7QJQ4_9BACT|nr:hypothetical protein [Acanthopleuribacter pedis]MBO1319478.1 hypothetical protein [Acanthopleuribacter pedis]